MHPKSGILLLLFLNTLQSTVIIAQPDTCGAPQKGGILADFNGAHSYVSYNVDAQHMKETSLVYQDRFCTNNGSGVIAKITSSEQREDIVIEVSEENVEVHLIQNGAVEPECIFKLNKKVTDGANYLIKIEFNGTELTMTLLNRYSKIYSVNVVDISACLQGKFLTFTFLEKGGEKIGESLSEAKEEAPTATVLSEVKGKPLLHGDFDGCIGDSMLNGVPVAQVGEQEEIHDIVPSCIHNFGPECTDICATTYIAAEGKKCSCPSESEIDKFGLCVQSCNCVTCQNGGTCVSKPGNDVICDCSPGFEGKYCQKKIDPCRGFDCLNGGSCRVQSTGPSCTCLPNFTGTKCEVFIRPEDPCEEAQCLNNGTCVRNNTLERKYSCSCIPGYDGELCEHKDEKKDAKITSEVIIAITVPSVVALGILVGLLALVINKRKKQEHNQANGEEKSSSSNNDS